jgi:hypothetical protein
MSARNNPLIKVLNLSYDTFNLLHRWFGRVVTLEILTHSISYAVYEVKTVGWAGFHQAITDGGVTMYGFIVSRL